MPSAGTEKSPLKITTILGIPCTVIGFLLDAVASAFFFAAALTITFPHHAEDPAKGVQQRRRDP